MSTVIKIIALCYGLVLFGTFLIMARNKKIKPFYTTLWLIVSLFMFSFIVFEKFYRNLAELIQVESATIFIIVGLISFLMIFVLHLSVKISVQSNKIQELITACSILEREIRILKKEEPGETEVK